MKPLAVLFGTIDPAMPGGIGATEYAFQQACERSGRARVTTMPFGRRRPGGSWLGLGLERIADLVGYVRRIRRERPDLVHLNTAYDRRALGRDLGYALLSRWLGQPLFLKYHGSDANLLASRHPLWRWMTATVLGGATRVGVLSSEEKRNFVAAGWPADKFVVVKNAVDRARFAAASWPRGAVPELLFIARLVPAKGLSETLRAVRILVGQGRRLTLTAVGDGPARAEAEALAGTLGLGEVVRFTGRVSEAETAAFYLRASVLAFPTAHGEGFSMTIFQALAAGLPIVTTRIRAAADWLTEPRHCLWVRAHDPEQLAERIGWLLDHPEAAAAMSAAEREHAHAFDVERVAAEYLDVYDDAVRSARGCAPTPEDPR